VSRGSWRYSSGATAVPTLAIVAPRRDLSPARTPPPTNDPFHCPVRVIMRRTRSPLPTTQLALVFVLLLSSIAIPTAESQAAGPTLLKRTLRLTTWRMSSYWRDKAAESPEWNTWSWVPRIYFEIVGPVEGGTQLSAEYTMPDGKPWFTDDLYTEELADGYWGKVETGSSNRDALEKLATLVTGDFGFTIRAKNELTGRNDVLMTGKFAVKKLHVGIPQRPNEFEYYVDQDWRLPIGTVWFNREDSQTSPPLYMGMWIRGNQWRFPDLAAYLFHNGKQIGSTKSDTWSHLGMPVDLLTMGSREDDPAWRLLVADFYGVLASRGENAGRDDLFFVDENPGEYEMKLLYSGKLVRSMKFTVGSDGQIVENTVTEDRPSGRRYIIPVKIAGGPDGTWRQDAWKSEAYYGNPLSGFTALPVGAN